MVVINLLLLYIILLLLLKEVIRLKTIETDGQNQVTAKDLQVLCE